VVEVNTVVSKRVLPRQPHPRKWNVHRDGIAS